MSSRAVGLRLALIIYSLSMSAANVTFDFETVSPGTITPFDVTAGGITATLSSPDGDVFSVADSAGLFTILAGNVVWDPGFPSHALDLVFSEPLAAITLSFALAGFPASSTIFIQAFAGGTGGVPVLTTSAMGGPAPPGFFPEGAVSISGSVFDAVRLTTNVESMAIDDVAVVPAAEVPEPSPAALMLSGFVALLRVASCRKTHNPHP
jgi:hypothetical protein